MHRNEEELLGEIALLEYLLFHDIRVAAPVNDKEGKVLQSFQAIEGIRRGILYQYAPGAPIIGQNDEQIILSAQYLARLHQKTEKLELPYNRKAYTMETMLWEPLQAILPAFEEFEYQEGYTVLKELSVTIVQNLDKLNTAAFTTGYCHYDFMPKNWHHDAQGAITLFDFDFAGKGWLINDIASYAVYLSLLNPGTQEIKDRLALFIRSYTDIRPLQPDELTAIPELCLLFCIFYLKYQYENMEDHTNTYFGPRFLRERIRHLQFMNEVLK
jgi:Ser/Thr protein kinase RdoA (MazF antagonist)